MSVLTCIKETTTKLFNSSKTNLIEQKTVLELEDHEGLGFHLGSSVRKKEGQKEVSGRKITTARNLQKTQCEMASRKKTPLRVVSNTKFSKKQKAKNIRKKSTTTNTTKLESITENVWDLMTQAVRENCN